MSAGLFGISYPAAVTEKLDTESLALPAFPLEYNLAGAVTQKALPYRLFRSGITLRVR